MKTSARNQFAGSVAAVRDGAVHDEVELEIAPGLRLVATVTRTSRVALGLEVGRTATALIKASTVVLVTGAEGMRFSARNQFAGTVESVVAGAVNDEVTIALPAGLRVVAIVTRASSQAMGLRPGVAATALVKASSVMLVTAG